MDAVITRTATDVLDEQKHLEAVRSNWEPLWEECREIAAPSAKNIYDTSNQGGQKNTEKIYDNTAMNAVGKLRAAIISIVCPDGEYYQELEGDSREINSDPQAKAWFMAENKEMFADRYAADANFTNENGQTIETGIWAGTSAIFIDSNPEGGVLYTHIPIKQLYIADDAYGRVMRLHRKYPLTARAIKNKYKDATPDKVNQAYEKDKNAIFYLIHSVYLNEDYQPNYKDARGMKWASRLVLEDGGQVIEEGGYFSFPYAVLRFRKVNGDPYGRSPLMDALPDSRMVQEQKRDNTNFNQRLLRPMLLSSNDAMFSKFKMKPNGMLIGGLDSQGRRLVAPLDIGGQPVLAEKMIENAQESIKETMMVNLLTQVMQSPEMNQLQVMELMKERANLLGPSLGAWQQEYFNAMTQRELDIRARQGRQVPLPQSLLQKKYKVKYTSPLNKAMKANEASAVMNGFAAVAPIIQAFPETAAEINPSKVVRTVLESYGAGAVLNDEATAEKMRGQMQKEKELQQMVAAAPHVGRAMKDATAAQVQASEAQ